MPFGMSHYPQVVVFKGKVYIGGGVSSKVYIGGGGVASSVRERQTVMVYDPQLDSFDTLPPYTCRYFSMAIVNNQLVMVGGVDVHTGKRTNKLGVWNEESRQWTHPLPPMTIACQSPSVTSHNNRWLVVMAGAGDGTELSRVEILDTTESRQWYHAAPLPQTCYQVSTVTIGNICYLLGGFSGGRQSKKVFRVNLDDLISQALSQPAGASAPPTPSPWMTLTDTPEGRSTAFSLNGSLLSVGGYGGSKAIYHYQPSSKNWIKAGELPAERSCCACTVLPSGEVFVAGGHYNGERVDIASVQ